MAQQLEAARVRNALSLLAPAVSLPPAPIEAIPVAKRKYKKKKPQEPSNIVQEDIVANIPVPDDELPAEGGGLEEDLQPPLGDDEEEPDPEPDETWSAWLPVTINPLARAVGTRGKEGPVQDGAPKFYPGRNKPGPRNIPDGTKSARGIFRLLFDEFMLDQFITNTNIHGQHAQGSQWRHVSVEIFFAFIVIILYMGISRMPKMSMHWETTNTEGSVYVKRLMSRNRFTVIFAALHYVNTTVLSAEEKNAAKKADCFWLLTPWLTRLSGNYTKYFFPGQKLDVDEKTVGFQGRHPAVCYNPNKPAKWALKFFALNDASTSYMLSFLPYRGRDETRPAGIPATEWPVMQLLANLEYHFIGIILSLDNWYTSLSILLWLGLKGIHMNGTVKVNRKGLPKEHVFKKTGKNKKVQGDMNMVESTKDGIKAYFISWQDSKPVHLLCSYLSFQAPVKRVIKQEKGRPKPEFGTMLVAQPAIIKQYNEGMGGTDVSDQLCSYYNFTHRTERWPHRIFTAFLMTTVTNAHIIYKSVNKVDIPLLDFLWILMSELSPATESEDEDESEGDLDSSCSSDDLESASKRRKSTMHGLPIRYEGAHFPQQIHGSRGICRWEECSNRLSSVKCQQCGVFLCIEGPHDQNCFTLFHTKK